MPNISDLPPIITVSGQEWFPLELFDGTTQRAQTRMVMGLPAMVLYAAYADAINFNSVADTAIPLALPTGVTRYRIQNIMISGASASISTATCGVFSAAAGGGTAIVTTGSSITVTASAENTNNNLQQLTIANGATASYNFSTLYFRVTNAQGSAATANVHIYLQPLP